MRRLSYLLPLLFVVLLALILGGCPSRQETTEMETVPPVGGEGPDVASVEPEPAAGEEAASVTLTKEMVKGFMASLDDEKVEEVLDAIAEDTGAEDDEDPETIRQALEQAASDPDLDEAVKAHGFSSGEEWVQAAKKILPGWGLAMAEVMDEMAKALGIEEDSEEYKKMMEERDEGFAAFTETFEPPTDEEVQLIIEALKEMQEEAGMPE